MWACHVESAAPACHRQLITFTHVHVGNYGVSEEARESDSIHAAAAIMREAVNTTDAAGAAVYGLATPTIAVGRPADLCLVDLEVDWEVGESGYESRSENCCFAGRRMRGRVLLTIASGAVAYRERALVAVGA